MDHFILVKMEKGIVMSEILEQAVAALTNKMGEASFGGSAKFDIDGEGCIMIDAAGVRAGDEEAEVTLRANTETFQDILAGDLDPASALMSGRLTIDGDMGVAMQLGSALG